MNKDLVNVFNDTLNHSNKLKVGITKKYNFSDIIKSDNTYVNNISIENLDTVSALEKYSKSGKVCILNMASYKRPGGGVINGARAQEECLFRCSNLYNSISDDFYPLERDSCLYTKDSLFFKDKNYEYINNINCDVITIAAINLNSSHHFYKDQIESNYESTTLDKIRLMVSIPSKHNIEYLILGAWGCGVFKNNPKKMSNFFKQVLITEGYSSLYKKVIFGIINDHNSVSNNYEVFRNHYL